MTSTVKKLDDGNAGGLVGLHGARDSRASALITASYATGEVTGHDNADDDPWNFGTDVEYLVLRVDFDGDGDVDADDVDPQRPVSSSPVEKTTDFNGDGRTNCADFFVCGRVWRYRRAL